VYLDYLIDMFLILF